MIYLDTHAVVWLYGNQIDLFPRKAIEAIEKNDCLVSPMTVLELHYLHETERIVVPAGRIVNELTAAIGLEICTKPFTEVAAQAGSLTWTRDPFDRIITAQAMVSHAQLITKDAKILSHYKRALWD